ncbi:MAG: TOBE domain-containing protein, partial [Marinobacter sp.]|nr:TOBE domain-containing protein [Marinobacter sp.]
AELRLDDGSLVQGRVASGELEIGRRAGLYIRPESLVLSGDALTSGFSAVQANVRATLFDGANSRVEAENGGQPVYARLPQDGSAPALSVGSAIRLAWDPALARVFGADNL